MAAPRKYPDELRERATRMAVQSMARSIDEVERFAVWASSSGSILRLWRNWVVQAEIDEGHRPGTTTSESQRLVELEKEVQLRRANSILEVSLGFFAASLDRPAAALIVEYIDQYRHEFGVEPICRTLTTAGTQIAPSTYYAFKTRPPSKRALRDEELLVEIHLVHAANFVYGAKKVHAAPRRAVVIARCTVEGHARRGVARAVKAKGPAHSRSPVVARITS